MKGARRPRSSRLAPARELAELRARLVEAEEALRAIRTGEVDALVVSGKQGAQVFTLEGAEHAYRVLIESMNEGALTLTANKTILYVNQCFARMIKCPLEQVMGSSFGRFLSSEDRAALRPLLKRIDRAGSKIQVTLHAADGSRIPAQISVRRLVRAGSNRATIGMVVTDMTEARHNEEMLREYSHRMVQAQEAERGRVALELHDHITQLLCAILIRLQAMVDRLSEGDGSSKRELVKLNEMLGKTAEEVERISRDLRPGVLDELGLVVVLRSACREFADRTNVSVSSTGVHLTARLPADTELALYRILQEALRNVEKYACARNVTVSLRRQGAVVQMVISDDGVGFDADHYPARRNNNGGLGLLSMRERAFHVGGTIKIKSARRAGTRIDVTIPLKPSTPAAN